MLRNDNRLKFTFPIRRNLNNKMEAYERNPVVFYLNNQMEGPFFRITPAAVPAY
ncbi:hypothetical protein SAMN05192582_101925 [Bacteroides ovatus]|jgi:hypothetical protein|uniref:Uncharacterized protein n=1 Tax=Bacteroides ovatus TaxID=28116 RepID=A0A1G8GNX1_BACOV|nr:hypothetical protein SAMN05192582_101925 [Bacteroides ovatus]